MLELFPARWSDLLLEHVAEFLAGAEDEPLQWEAKGTQLDAHAVRKGVGAFANSHDGGFLILGAERDGDAWKLTGFEFPGEPRLWVSNTIHDGLRPVPAYDVHVFPVPGRHVVVVWIAPLPDPPCVTRGTIYERVPGQSIPVKDPLRLAALYRGGENARAAAEARSVAGADRVANLVLVTDECPIDQGCGFAVGLSRVGPGADIGAKMFTQSFANAVIAMAESHTVSGPIRGNVDTVDVGQGHIHVVSRSGFRDLRWAVSATWDGGVAAGVVHPEEKYLHEESLVQTMIETWGELLELTKALGGVGDHFMAARLKSSERDHDRTDGSGALALIQRGPQSTVPDDAGTAHLIRELKRINGYNGLVDD